jgi:hypothetical protein
VEETRQHSTLDPDSFTPDEIGLAILGGAGVLAVAAGLAAQVIVGGRSILLGILAFTVSRALMRLWQLARRRAFPRNRASPQLTMGLAIFWLLLSLCLSVPFWGFF